MRGLVLKQIKSELRADGSSSHPCRGEIARRMGHPYDRVVFVVSPGFQNQESWEIRRAAIPDLLRETGERQKQRHVDLIVLRYNQLTQEMDHSCIGYRIART